jgi:protein subunit release factor B
MKYPVTPEKARELAEALARAGIREQDLEERFVRASGPGGQKVNKTSTAVCLRHVPSGLEVRVQTSRSQALNRFLARRLLAERVAMSTGGATPALDARIEKARRRKHKRARRARQRAAAEAGTRVEGKPEP